MTNDNEAKPTTPLNEESSDERRRLNPIQVIGSTLAAGLGVQSSKNRERDFKQGSLGTFVVAGLLFTAIFIGTLYAIVKMVLATSTS